MLLLHAAFHINIEYTDCQNARIHFITELRVVMGKKKTIKQVETYMSFVDTTRVLILYQLNDKEHKTWQLFKM